MQDVKAQTPATAAATETVTDTSGAHVFLILWKAWRAVEAHDARGIRETLGMCPTDFQVLEILLHKGAMAVNAIGRRIQLSSGSITTAIDRLEKRGLVQRQAHPEDRRVAHVHLTDTGRDTIKVAFARQAAVLEAAAAGLDQAERAQLIALLKKLGKAAEAAFSPAG